MSKLCQQVAVVFALMISSQVPSTFADGVADEADLQFQLGAESYQQSEFLAALQHFLASNRLVPNRNVMFNIARTYEQLSRFPEAFRYYTDALKGESSGKRVAEIEAAITRIGSRVAQMTITTQPAGATIYLDRRDLGSVGSSPARLGLKPGKYKLIVALPGYEPVTLGPIEAKLAKNTPVNVDLVQILGSVKVVGESGTAVRVDRADGEVACVTPCSLSLPPGDHVFYFARADYRSSPTAVTVKPNQVISVVADLEEVTGSLLVSADEDNALIEVDGKAVGFTPSVIDNVAVGRRLVRVTLRGYKPVEKTVDIEVGKQASFEVEALELLNEVSAASRRTQQVDDAPASVTIISRQEINAFAYPTIFEALRGVRGAALTYDSIYGNAAIRGLGQSNDYNNRLLVLSDGAVLNENILYQPFIHYDGRTDLGDVERIEVVRGPGSVLYGTGAVSGVVNLVMRGRDEPTGAHAQISATDDAVARVRGGVNVRLGDDTGVWASVAAARSDGRDAVLEFDADGDGSTERNAVNGLDSFNAYTLTAKGWWKDVTAQVFYTSRSIGIPTGSFGSLFNRLENSYQDRRFLTELRYEPRLSPSLELQARAYANMYLFDLEYLYDAEDDEGAFEQTYNEEYTSVWGGAEARLLWSPEESLRITAGGDLAIHSQVDMDVRQFDRQGQREAILDVGAPYQNIAGYALAEWTASPKVEVSAGLRADYRNNSQEQLGSFSGMPLASDFTSVNPRAAVILKPTSNDLLKLMIGRAFRAPSTYEYFYTDGGVTQVSSDCCGETLEPETTYTSEVEYTRKLGNDWSALLAAHATYASTIIETRAVPDDIVAANGLEEGVSYYRNSDVDQILVGGDLEVRRRWRSGVMASAHYGLLVARYTDSPNDDPALPSDQRVPNAPLHFGALKLVAPVIPRLASAAFRASLEAPRRIATDSSTTTDAAVIADFVISGELGNAGVSYAAGVYNLFNWQSELPAEPFASRLLPQRPRSFILSLTLSR